MAIISNQPISSKQGSILSSFQGMIGVKDRARNV